MLKLSTLSISFMSMNSNYSGCFWNVFLYRYSDTYMPGVIFSSGLPGVRRFKIRRCHNSSIFLKLLSINIKLLLLKVKYVAKDALWDDLCLIVSSGKCVRICLDIVQKSKSVTWYSCSFAHLCIKIPECVLPVCINVCLCVHLHISVCRIC